MNTSAMCDRFCAAIRPRLPGVMAFFALALWSLAPAAAGDDRHHDDHHHHLRVMNQNLYIGSFFQELNGATTASDYVAAATQIYQHIIATRPAERAVVLADEIAKQRPDFVSL